MKKCKPIRSLYVTVQLFLCFYQQQHLKSSYLGLQIMILFWVFSWMHDLLNDFSKDLKKSSPQVPEALNIFKFSK